MTSARCRIISILILIIASAFLVTTFFFPSSTSTTTQQKYTESTSEQKSVCHKRFAFFGDSNTLGMALLGQNMGWRALGGYPRFFLERQRSTCKMSQVDEAAVSKNHTSNNNNNNNTDTDPFKSFTSPLHVFAIAGATLAGEGDGVKLFSKFEPFERATELFSRNKINNESIKTYSNVSFVHLDVAFLMFGTNDCVKTNTKNTSTRQHIYNSYRKFIREQIFENFGARRVVVVTPPRILPFCLPPYCTRHDRNQLEVDIVGVLRQLVGEMKSETKLQSREIDLVDFFEIQTEMIRRSHKMMNASLLFDAWQDQMKKTIGNFTPIPFSLSQRRMMEHLLVEYEALKSMYQSDGVHMNVKGHKILADYVWKTLTTRNN